MWTKEPSKSLPSLPTRLWMAWRRRRLRPATSTDPSSHPSQMPKMSYPVPQCPSPVARLPPEILCAIFHILSSLDHPGRKFGNPQVELHLGWLEVTHVCQRWRSVAINDPSLWAAHIAIPFPLDERWANTFISRAQSSSLTIQACGDLYSHWQWTRPTPAELALVGANLVRTERVQRVVLSEATLPAFCTGAPLLHTLDIFSLYFLPDNLLGGAAGAPRLRHMRVILADSLLPRTLMSPLLAQLTSLEIARGYHYGIGTALAQLLAALRKMHALERLAPGFILHKNGQEPHDSVALEKLCHLQLHTNVADARMLLEHLALPTNASVTCCLKPYTASNLPELVAALFPALVACVDWVDGG
ncbi:hypothetical protein FA95DRAFT_780117 [Auriscalpium vulgare]|uniref:Uncharacterized protein n=1 Tax=Auriscalpium vulgare TaxID=40419 RepID=A0ACB8S090_9AGAM|nr:hypothetical protein FA95DRAFT_780117 [Auriscalpium vulgare]